MMGFKGELYDTGMYICIVIEIDSLFFLKSGILHSTFLGTKGFMNYVRSTLHNNNGTPIIGVMLSVNNTLALALGTYICTYDNIT